MEPLRHHPVPPRSHQHRSDGRPGRNVYHNRATPPAVRSRPALLTAPLLNKPTPPTQKVYNQQKNRARKGATRTEPKEHHIQSAKSRKRNNQDNTLLICSHFFFQRESAAFRARAHRASLDIFFAAALPNSEAHSDRTFDSCSFILQRVDFTARVRLYSNFPDQNSHYLPSDVISFRGQEYGQVEQGSSRITREVSSLDPDEIKSLVLDFTLQHLRRHCQASVDYERLNALVDGLPDERACFWFP
jgi:hypothetical protein